MTTKRARAIVPSVVLAAFLGTLSGCGGGLAARGATTTTTAGTPSAAANVRPETREENDREPEGSREAASTDKGPSDHRVERVAGWVSLAIGAQATVVALVTSGMMLHEDGIRGDACDAQQRCTQEGLDANANLRQLGGWNAGAYVVAGAGLTVGTVLLLLHPARERARPARRAESSSPSLTLGAPGAGPGLGLRGTF